MGEIANMQVYDIICDLIPSRVQEISQGFYQSPNFLSSSKIVLDLQHGSFKNLLWKVARVKFIKEASRHVFPYHVFQIEAFVDFEFDLSYFNIPTSS